MKTVLSWLKFVWNWLVFSSADPSKFALTVKGLGSLFGVQVVFNTILPMFGVHASLDSKSVFDALSGVAYYGASLVSLAVGFYGAFRKLVLTVQSQGNAGLPQQ